MPLTKAERNALMEALLRGGLKAEDCTFRVRTPASSTAFVDTHQITHKPTGSRFDLHGPVGSRFSWDGQMHTGTDTWMQWTARDWAGALGTAERWAGETAQWERTPDLWALGMATLPDAADNSLFTQLERDEIAKRLDEVEQLAREKFGLPDDQVAAIGRAVEELKEASERIGRKDWKLMFYGALVSLGLEHAVSPGVVETLFRLAVQGLGHIFGAASPPMITA